MNDSIRFDYYYGKEAEQFSFFRVPRLLIKDARFKGLSSDAKLLYGLMLDRMALSIKNEWVDDENRAYIYYTLKDIMEDLGCSRGTCIKTLSELDSKNGIGLIEKKRQGLGRPDIIYVKNFVADEEREKPQTSRSANFELPEVQNLDFKKSKNRTSRSTESELAEVQDLDPNYTKDNKTNNSDTNRSYNQSIHLSNQRPVSEVQEDEMDRITMLKNQIKENIEYDYFMKYSSVGEKELFEELYEIICDVILLKRKTVRIGGDDYPAEVVRAKFMKLDQMHIQYVMDCLKKTRSDIKTLGHT